MSSILKSIDDNITNEATKLFDLSTEISFVEVATFILGQSFPEIPPNLTDQKGIYFFELKNSNRDLTPLNWKDNFAPRWKNENIIWYPGLKKGRINAHKVFEEWIPFYIGKSLNVGKRIHEHIYQLPYKTTFSMKLNARTNLHGEEFRISYVELNVVNYHMIAPVLESHFRNRFNPIIGKQ